MVCYEDQGPYAHQYCSGSLKVDRRVRVSARVHLDSYITISQNLSIMHFCPRNRINPF